MKFEREQAVITVDIFAAKIELLRVAIHDKAERGSVATNFSFTVILLLFPEPQEHVVSSIEYFMFWSTSCICPHPSTLLRATRADGVSRRASCPQLYGALAPSMSYAHSSSRLHIDCARCARDGL